MAANALTAGSVVTTIGDWSTQQSSRRRSLLYDAEANLLGRRLSATPKHLSRVLYFPRHGKDDNDTYHLPVYDISRRYKESIADTPVGSSLYIVKLGTMKPPRGDGTDDVDVAYLVDFERKYGYDDGLGSGNDEAKRLGEVEGHIVAKVQRVGPLRGDDDDEVELKISTSPEEAGFLTFKEPFGTGDKAIVPIGISYPIAASKTRLGNMPHPFFAFKVPGIFGPTVFQWQIHPVQDGPLRYTLVVVPSSITEGNNQPEQPEPESTEIRAIYHHIGLGVSLTLPYSEGVLLLPKRGDTLSADSEWEGVVVASLLGMLWRLRGMGTKAKNRKRASIGTINTTTKTNTTSEGPGKKGNILSKLKVKIRRHST